jgi:predicted NAD/FAD-dependent oxidoreductase
MFSNDVLFGDAVWQAPPTDLSRPVDLGDGLYVCGDHRATATLDGALVSGRRAAEAILAKKL